MMFISTPIRRLPPACCARATNGHAAPEPTITLMKSRRRIAFPEAEDHAKRIADYIRDLRPAKWGSGPLCMRSRVQAECPLWGLADISRHSDDVRFIRESGLGTQSCEVCLCQKTHALQQFFRYSITSLARVSHVGGSARPSALAVVRFIMKSNLVGCWIGISPGLAPRRILSTYSAERRNRSG